MQVRTADNDQNQGESIVSPLDPMTLNSMLLSSIDVMMDSFRQLRQKLILQDLELAIQRRINAMHEVYSAAAISKLTPADDDGIKKTFIDLLRVRLLNFLKELEHSNKTGLEIQDYLNIYDSLVMLAKYSPRNLEPVCPISGYKINEFYSFYHPNGYAFDAIALNAYIEQASNRPIPMIGGFSKQDRTDLTKKVNEITAENMGKVAAGVPKGLVIGIIALIIIVCVVGGPIGFGVGIAALFASTLLYPTIVRGVNEIDESNRAAAGKRAAYDYGVNEHVGSKPAQQLSSTAQLDGLLPLPMTSAVSNSPSAYEAPYAVNPPYPEAMAGMSASYNPTMFVKPVDFAQQQQAPRIALSNANAFPSSSQ